MRIGAWPDHWAMHLHKITATAAGIALLAIAPAAGAAPRDRDHDGMSDRWERKHQVRSASSDADRDGLSNRAEYESATNPRRKDTDRDGVRDPAEDHDRDRIANVVEVATANDPGSKDSDDDGTLDTSEGAGRIVAVDGTTVTIALAAKVGLGSGVADPLELVADDGRRITGRAEPGALICQPAWEWQGPVDTSSDGFEDDAQREAAAEEAFEDGEESDEEVAQADKEDGDAGLSPEFQAYSMSEQPVEGNPVLSDDELERIEDAEYERIGHEEDPDWKTVTDACPAGTMAPGTWVHEVTVSRSEEAGVEFEELLVVE